MSALLFFVFCGLMFCAALIHLVGIGCFLALAAGFAVYAVAVLQ